MPQAEGAEPVVIAAILFDMNLHRQLKMSCALSQFVGSVKRGVGSQIIEHTVDYLQLNGVPSLHAAADRESHFQMYNGCV